MLACLRGTTTMTGLSVQDALLDGTDATGRRVSDTEMATLNLTAHDVGPTWNDTLRPRSAVAPASATAPQHRDVLV